MVENAKNLKAIRIIGSVVFALLLVLFVLCMVFAKMQMDNSFGLFGTTFAVKKSIDECNLPNGSLVFIKPTAANTSSVVAYVANNQIRLTEKAYLPSNAKIIGGATGYAPILGEICSYVYQNTFAFGAFAVLLVALLVFLITYKRGGNKVKIQTRRRISFQTLWFIITNSFIIGYIKGS
ncbi:MAG: hypothetical protein GX802_01315, partial [Clostridiales bacterium]|nr:hypothetical protein [Clostridiales bacterium]